MPTLNIYTTHHEHNTNYRVGSFLFPSHEYIRSMSIKITATAVIITAQSSVFHRPVAEEQYLRKTRRRERDATYIRNKCLTASS